MSLEEAVPVLPELPSRRHPLAPTNPRRAPAPWSPRGTTDELIRLRDALRAYEPPATPQPVHDPRTRSHIVEAAHHALLDTLPAPIPWPGPEHAFAVRPLSHLAVAAAEHRPCPRNNGGPASAGDARAVGGGGGEAVVYTAFRPGATPYWRHWISRLKIRALREGASDVAFAAWDVCPDSAPLTARVCWPGVRQQLMRRSVRLLVLRSWEDVLAGDCSFELHQEQWRHRQELLGVRVVVMTGARPPVGALL